MSSQQYAPTARRIARAREIASSIASSEVEYLESCPLQLRREGSVEGWHKYVLVTTSRPAPRIGLQLGELVHQLRASLDNLVVLLADTAAGRTLSDKETATHQFPICGTQAEFTKSIARGCLRHLTADVVARIEEVQPYRDLRVALPEGIPRRAHPLSQLRAVSNRDKHRRITLVGQVVERVMWSAPTDSPAPEVRMKHPPHNDGDVVLEVRPDLEVDPQLKPALVVAIPAFHTSGHSIPAQWVPVSSFATILVDQIEREVVNHVLAGRFLSPFDVGAPADLLD